MGIGVLSLTALLLFKRFLPAAPAALIVVAITTGSTWLLGLEQHGVSIVGDVSGGIPLPAIPSTSWDELLTLFPGALAIAVIGFAETNSVAEEFAERHRYRIRPNQELLAIGAANVLSGLFKGFITGGGASQSAANDVAGARSQVANIVVCGLTFVTAIALTPLFTYLPNAALGAIVISAVLGFLKVRELQRIRGLRRDSLVLAMIALGGVLVLGIVPGLLVGIALSVLLLLGRLSRPSDSVLGRLGASDAYAGVERYPQATQIPGVLIYRLDAPLLFINAQVLRERLRNLVADAEPPVHALVLDLEASNDLDIKSLDALQALLREQQEAGRELWLAGVHAQVLEMLKRSGLEEKIGQERIHKNVALAVEASVMTTRATSAE